MVFYWIEFGFDGIRVDVLNEVFDLGMFFLELRKVVKEKKFDVYFVGEIWMFFLEWVKGDCFDFFMNYVFGRDIFLNYVKGLFSGESVMKMMGCYYVFYGENVVVMGFNFVDLYDILRVFIDFGGGKLGDILLNELI